MVTVLKVQRAREAQPLVAVLRAALPGEAVRVEPLADGSHAVVVGPQEGPERPELVTEVLTALARHVGRIEQARGVQLASPSTPF